MSIELMNRVAELERRVQLLEALLASVGKQVNDAPARTTLTLPDKRKSS